MCLSKKASLLVTAVISQCFFHCVAFPAFCPAFLPANGLRNLFRELVPKRDMQWTMSLEGSIASEVRSENSNQKRMFYFSDGVVRAEGEASGSSKSEALRILSKPSAILSATVERLQRFLFATFLPVGFPGSVPPEYVRFQLWNVLQDLSSNLRGIMSTQKLLEGMGVGKAGVTSLAATLQWMARDGSAMIGGLIFTAIASANFGRNVKRWRMFADLVNDVALTIDMFAPAFPLFFLPLICISSVLKAMCGISAGACNNAIMQHWALRGNIADVGAKSGAQHTLVSLLALPLGMAFASWVNAVSVLLWPSFVLLTALHIYANYAMLKSLALRTLSPSQLDRLLPPLLHLPPSSSSSTSEQTSAPSPVELARSDPIFWLPRPFSRPPPFRFHFGVSLSAVSSQGRDLSRLIASFQGEKFLISDVAGARRRFACVIAEGATARDHLRAYITAHLLAAASDETSSNKPGGGGGGADDGGEVWARKVASALVQMKREVRRVREELRQAGWDVDSVSLGDAGWIARW